MKNTSTLFLKTVIVLLAIVIATCLVWFPQNEGRATNLDLISIYSDPFILYIYLASTPFFVALYQAFKLLSYVDKNSIFSKAAITAVRNIKYCAITTCGLIVLSLVYIRFFVHGDDPAGPTMLGFIAILISIVIATSAAIFQKLLQNAVDIKSENDLTV